MAEQPRLADVPTANGELAEIWFGAVERMKVPRAVRLDDARKNVSYGGTISLFVHTDCWDSGLMFMAPGHTTCIFSMEVVDDGSADEWYGPTQEFYYIIAGEFTVWYDTDAERLKRKESANYRVRAGEYAVHPVGWKFQIQCASSTPGTFLWCKNIPPGARVQERVQVPLER